MSKSKNEKLSATQRADKLIEVSEKELSRRGILPYKSFMKAVKKESEYLLSLAENISENRLVSLCPTDKLKILASKLVIADDLSEDELRDLLLERKNNTDIFKMSASNGALVYDKLKVKVLLFEYKLNLIRTKKMLAKLLPIYLNIEYVLNGNQWGFFDRDNLTWSSLDSLGLTWNELEEKEW